MGPLYSCVNLTRVLRAPGVWNPFEEMLPCPWGRKLGHNPLLPAKWFWNIHQFFQITNDEILLLLLVHFSYNSCNIWYVIKEF